MAEDIDVAQADEVRPVRGSAHEGDSPGDAACDPPCHGGRDNSDKDCGGHAVRQRPVNREVDEIDVGNRGQNRTYNGQLRARRPNA